MQSAPERFTVGIEEEYQLVSPEDGGLRSRAREVLGLDWSEEIRPEIQTTMLEIGTRVCPSAAAADEEVRRLRMQVASAAEAADLRLVAAGVHPFNRISAYAITPGKRYEDLAERFGRVLRTEHVYGMHVHVSVPEDVDRMRVIARIRWWIPHLLALSGSSPFYNGEDTGFSSYRSMLFRRLPHTGPPPRVSSEEEYRKLISAIVKSGVALDEGTVYWSIRPSRKYRTVEFRSIDVCPRAEDAVAIAALARALVAAACLDRLRIPDEGLPGVLGDALLTGNEWLTARYGLDAELALPDEIGGKEPVRDGIRRALETVGPTSDELGDSEQLAGIERILERGNAADRMRARYRRNPDLHAMVEWLTGESQLGIGMDRRGEQRVGSA